MFQSDTPPVIWGIGKHMVPHYEPPKVRTSVRDEEEIDVCWVRLDVRTDWAVGSSNKLSSLLPR